MEKVTSIGYHDTGSSVVVDYIKEFRNVVYPEIEVECRYLEDPDGISDLEYYLVDNWNRLNQGFAIKRFEKFAKRYGHHYRLLFGENWERCTNDLVKELVTYSYPGYWHCDISLFPIPQQLLYYAKRGFNRLLPSKYRKKPDYNYFPNAITYYSHPERNDFYRIVKSFSEELFKSISTNKEGLMILDQSIPATNISRYLNYLDDFKVILVDRDPRDVYIEEQHIDDHVLPADPFVFANIYLDMRKTQEFEIKNRNVLFIRFEDMIYNYDITSKMVRDFLNLKEEDHVNPKKYFDPNRSIKNTRMWERFPQHKDAIQIFDSILSDYYYFEKV